MLLMFLLSLLVLVVAIQVSYACTCEPRPFEDVICDSETVISATVEDEVLLDEYGKPVFLESMSVSAKYEMYLSNMCKNEPNPLFLNGSRYFHVVIPRQKARCDQCLTISKNYLLSGIVTKEGMLDIYKCVLITPLDEGDDEEDDHIDNLRTDGCRNHSEWI